MIIQPVILSGGSGTRLWPLSREHQPKQLLPLVGEDTLLQQTALRLHGLDTITSDDDPALDVAAPLVVCNDVHRYQVAEQLRLAGTPAAGILLEPIGRNTAPALTVAALEAMTAGQDPLLLVMPADHVVGDKGAFHAAVRIGATLADQGKLVTFGIVPDSPNTGYGYIQRGAAFSPKVQTFELARFVEKPDRDTAKDYVDSGDYYWNSGMFLVKASVWLEQASRHCPDISEACRDAHGHAQRSGEFLSLDADRFGACPSDSIDYAVMEKLEPGSDSAGGSNSAAVVPLDAQWSDVGSWEALWEVLTKDAAGNALKGDVLAEDCRNSLIFAEHRFVGAVGIEDMIVIETADAVLVLPKAASQEVKKIVQQLKQAKRNECETHRRVFRPWGTYEPLDQASRFQVKRIVVNPGAAISLQMHHHRAEHWVVVKGTARVSRGDESFLLTENQSTFIPLGTRHRLENPGLVPLEIIEIQSGGYLGEDDIVRFEDDYGRS